jgi:hypothetical protein
VSHALVGGWEHELAKLIEVELLILSAIILTDYIVDIGDGDIHVLLLHEVEQIESADLIVAIDIDELEDLHGLKVWMSRQVLSSHFDKRFVGGQVSENSGQKSVGMGFSIGFTAWRRIRS